MRRREYLLWAALVLACSLWLTGFAREEKKRWEYTTVLAHAFEDSPKLNRAGAEGWELVGVTTSQNPSDPKTFYFKRAR